VEYQSNIANGFRFQQRSWANNQLCVLALFSYSLSSSPSLGVLILCLNLVNHTTTLHSSFPPRKTQTVGLDPVIGQVGNDAARTTFGLNPFNVSQSFSIPQFLKSKGGEYFFSPSLSALKNTIAK